MNAELSTSQLNAYAIIETGGKQYRVGAGSKLKVEQLKVEVGTDFTIDRVLAISTGAGQLAVGTPTLAGASVGVRVLAHGRHKKVRIFKLRRRKHYRKQQGHRQGYTELLISQLSSAPGKIVALVGETLAAA